MNVCTALKGTIYFFCSGLECSPPPAVVYTVVNGNRRSVGSKVQYKCTTDAVTAFTSVCLDTGTWSSVPACPIGR